jgi:hypothetical protein
VWKVQITKPLPRFLVINIFERIETVLERVENSCLRDLWYPVIYEKAAAFGQLHVFRESYLKTALSRRRQGIDAKAGKKLSPCRWISVVAREQG